MVNIKPNSKTMLKIVMCWLKQRVTVFFRSMDSEGKAAYLWKCLVRKAHVTPIDCPDWTTMNNGIVEHLQDDEDIERLKTFSRP